MDAQLCLNEEVLVKEEYTTEDSSETKSSIHEYMENDNFNLISSDPEETTAQVSEENEDSSESVNRLECLDNKQSTFNIICNEEENLKRKAKNVSGTKKRKTRLPKEKPKKLSGAQFRKLRMEKEKRKMEELQIAIKEVFFKGQMPVPLEGEENDDSLEKISPIEEYLKIEQTEINFLTNDTERRIFGSSDSHFMKSQVIKDSISECISPILEDGAGNEQLMSVLSNDPGTWPAKIDAHTARMLTERGPFQVKDFDFPCSSTGRKFSKTYYYRQLPNGEEIPRDWLIYSVLNNSVYCFCCKVFGDYKKRLSYQIGCSDWQHLTFSMVRHEKSLTHNENMKSWIVLKKSLKSKTEIDTLQQRVLDGEKKHWYAVIERIIAIIRYLASQGLAFRGSSSNTLFDDDNGNFLKAIEMISRFDAIMLEHINRIERSKDELCSTPNYLGYQIHSEIINIVGLKIKDTILNMIRKFKYFSIILDCTPDENNVEHLAIIIRFVSLNSKQVEVREHFLGLCPMTDSSGEDLSAFVLRELLALNLNIFDIRGQGYDNGTRMRGKHSGFQAKIMKINPRAFFVPCSAQSLNVLVNDTASISYETINFFGLVQELFVFLCGSTKRWAVLERHVVNLNLMPFRDDTRWSSRMDAMKLLRYDIALVYDALVEIADDKSQDFDTNNAAHSLALKISNYKFLCCIVTWYNVLYEINVVSEMIQNEKTNISSCLTSLRNLATFLTNTRTDNDFGEMLTLASDLAKNLDVEPKLCATEIAKPRRKKRKADAESNDDPIISDPVLDFKVNFYNFILNQAFTSIIDRFQTLYSYNETFGFLYRIVGASEEELQQCCKNLHLKLSHEQRNESDIDGAELFDEIKTLKRYLNCTEDMNPQDILQYIFENNLQATFPNVFISLRILLTLPVTVATVEHSSCKLNTVKKYLKSTNAQDELETVSIISMEHDVLDGVDLHDTISEFALSKARSVTLL
ncbi:PREDICTED: zinc finger MYM-type protein 1-like isoform X2 [Nicrophorus vespilloides]|uniref:Zinc finger MYM-type protein 1-like isoform X2 n=1 Tax=Nicrophorus vespilloides TaxID=110193 RepID=A0ABM1NHI6_NICVS|nr:PREDICTED: zinc finger MYM-type protein 1-like isoform X2 [Nicrophorus vespilloides]